MAPKYTRKRRQINQATYKNQSSGKSIDTNENEHWNADDVEKQITESSKYQDVHVVDINGRVMDYPKNSTPISDFSKSLPRNFLY